MRNSTWTRILLPVLGIALAISIGCQIDVIRPWIAPFMLGLGGWIAWGATLLVAGSRIQSAIHWMVHGLTVLVALSFLLAFALPSVAVNVIAFWVGYVVNFAGWTMEQGARS